MSETPTCVEEPSLQSERTTVVRRPQRGHYDFPTIAAILDEAFVGYIGFARDGQPYVLPAAFGRDGRTIYFHGHGKNGMFNAIAAGIPVCFTAMIMDEFVLAKSAFRHSMNYRSVVVLGKPELVAEHEKQHALKVLTNHAIPGRWNDVRLPSQQELDATIVVKLAIEEASAKIRTGPPVDVEVDQGRDAWSGVIPIRRSYLAPQRAPDCGPTAATPKYAEHYVRPNHR